MKIAIIVLFFCSGFLDFRSVHAEELPRGSTENCFYIMPLFEKIRVPGALTLEEKRYEIQRMKAQLGKGNLYHRLGFSSIYAPNVEGEVRPVLQMLQENGLHYGVIFALQSHTRNSLRAVAEKDLRLFQWRKDGIDWKGSYTSSGTLEVPEDERDYKVPTPSRYATPLRSYNAQQAADWANSVKKLMADFPAVITCINGPIEEELPVGGLSNTEKLGDYSPFAITEFRDWLRHTGFYDAATGKYKGEGASEYIIGNLISFNGTMRSQFYDDPNPSVSNETGVSFNSYFGTDFTSWNLRYWDLDLYPAAITDPAFDCTPDSGTGFQAGGFDAPRILNGKSKFWSAWTWDMPDQGGFYPAGNPASPAFGFRQFMVRNFVRDLFDEIAAVGIPREIMYAHQIPGDVFLGFTGAGARNRSSASTIWSGYLEKSKTIGITRFGNIDPSFMTQYASDWGIFEWHPSPNTAPGSQVLYNKSIADLNAYYSNKCHYLFPGWWKNIPDNDLRFPLTDSRFAEAISDFMKQCKEVPWTQQGNMKDYSPPGVTGLFGYLKDSLLKLSWNEQIWPGLIQKWSDWGSFSHFEVQKSTDGTNWTVPEKVDAYQISVKTDLKSFKIRVRAVSKTKLEGDWSETITVDKDSYKGLFSLTAEFNSLIPDSSLFNRITIKLKDPTQVIIPDLLTIKITGDGSILNSEPENKASIEKFWPMNSISELTNIYRLDNALCTDGFFQATVSPITPIDPYFYFSGSKIEGSKLPYISFRLYSDVSANGQLFWFIPGGNKSINFAIKKGWNHYSFSNLPDWISQTSISSIRLDPGIIAHAKIMLDWFALSSQPIAEKVKVAPLLNGNSATFITSPTSKPGTYTVSVEIGGAKEQIMVSTQSTSGSNQISFEKRAVKVYPNPAKSSLYIQLNEKVKGLVEIVSLNGSVVQKKDIFDEENIIVSLEGLPEGVYLLRIVGKNEIVIRKFLKY